LIASTRFAFFGCIAFCIAIAAIINVSLSKRVYKVTF